VQIEAQRMLPVVTAIVHDMKPNIIPTPIPSVPMTISNNGQIELQLVQQPPSQAVYQRILRPFPTVAIIGAHPKAASNYFVEVTMLKKSTFDDTSDFQYVTYFKPNPANGTTASNNNNSDKEKNMIGGQLVQRCEPGSNVGNMLVVFRKLKILTTSSQQGAFFVLRFALKRYVDNVFEAVPNVNAVISNPIDVFSHTLYLKGRPVSKSKRSSSPNSTEESFSEIHTDAALLASMSSAPLSRGNSEETSIHGATIEHPHDAYILVADAVEALQQSVHQETV